MANEPPAASTLGLTRFDNPKELIDKVRLGENVKELHRDAIADELSAFANTWGGVGLIRSEQCATRRRGHSGRSTQWGETSGSRSLQTVRRSAFDTDYPSLLASGDGAAVVIKVEIVRGLFPHWRPSKYPHRLGSRLLPIVSAHVVRLLYARSNSSGRW